LLNDSALSSTTWDWLNQYKDLAQLHEAIALAIYYYNTKRIHIALKMSPSAYAATLNLGKDNVFRKKERLTGRKKSPNSQLVK